jgi:hypothetical protein
VIGFLLLSLPVFGVVGLGWAAMRARLASQEACDALGAFSLQFALPALVLRLIATRPLESSFHSSFYVDYLGCGGLVHQLGALGLVVNMIVLWNTIYMEAVLEQLRKEGYPVNEEDKARLSPLIHEHINTQGRHSFMMPEAVVKGELRPLRNPADDLD